MSQRPASKATPAAVVQSAAAGDARAFRTIFDAHAPAVRRFLGDLLRDDGLADEATQETFVRAHRRLATLENSERIRPWLIGIARLVAKESYRRRGSWLRRFVGGDRGERAAGEVIDTAADPQQRVIGAESAERMQRALGVLPPDKRSALLMRIEHGLSYEEIGRSLGWSLAKVKTEIFRARQEMRAQLEKGAER